MELRNLMTDDERASLGELKTKLPHIRNNVSKLWRECDWLMKSIDKLLDKK